MKKYLIDTHILLWLIFDPDKIDKKKLELLKNRKNKILVADISFWEISLKYNLGKLELSGLIPDELPKIAEQMGLEVIDVNKDVMASFYKLPKTKTHKDPFDRIIIWKCISSSLVLITQDNKFQEYQPYGLKFL